MSWLDAKGQLEQPSSMSATLESQILPPLLKAAVKRGATPLEMVGVLVSSLEQAFEGHQFAGRELQTARFQLAGRAGRIALIQEEGGCVDSAEAAKLYLGNPRKTANPETVRKAARENRLISIRDGHGDLLFPVWQFADTGGALAGLPAVLKALAERPGYSDVTPFRFFLQHHPRTSGRPLDALRAGQIDDVIASALAERD